MPDAISLGVGEPDFVTPWHIREATIFALEKGRTSYTDNRGLGELRGEISLHVEKNYGVGYNPEDEILVTVGVSEALDLALRAILDPGDKVLYHQPCYVSYHPGVVLAHGVPIGVPTSALNDFAIDPDALEAAWEPGCKVLMLNFPTNPTGGIANREVLERIARFAAAADQTLQDMGREILDQVDRDNKVAIVMIGRPYHNDPGLNHGVPEEFQVRGYPILSVRSLPRDPAYMAKLFGPGVDPLDIADVWPENYSANSAQKVWAARYAARHPNLAILDLSSFKCGHDAPTYGIIEKIVSTSKVPFSALHEIDANKPGGSILIRVLTTIHKLKLVEELLSDQADAKVELARKIADKRAEILARIVANREEEHHV